MDNSLAVLDQLFPLTNYSRELGLALKLPEAVLDKIYSEHKNAHDHLRAVIEAFLMSTQPSPTWRTIIQALRTPGVNRFQLAEDIERKFSMPLTAGNRSLSTLECAMCSFGYNTLFPVCFHQLVSQSFAEL